MPRMSGCGSKPAAGCACAIAAQHHVEPRVIGGQLPAVGLRMPEVNDTGREAAVLAAHARMQQADQQIGILAAPTAEAGIEPVDPLEIRAPDRKIAGARAPPLTRPQFAQWSERQPQHGGEPVDAAAQALPDPARCAPGFRPQAVAQHGRSEGRRQQHAVASDEPSAFGEPAMRGDEIGRSDAIAVEEDAVIAVAHENGSVADFCGAKAAIHLPHVIERNT